MTPQKPVAKSVWHSCWAYLHTQLLKLIFPERPGITHTQRCTDFTCTSASHRNLDCWKLKEHPGESFFILVLFLYSSLQVSSRLRHLNPDVLMQTLMSEGRLQCPCCWMGIQHYLRWCPRYLPDPGHQTILNCQI